MRDHLFKVVDRGPRQRQQTMIAAHDGLADEVQPMLEEEVVGLVDAPGLRVVHGYEPVVDPSHLDRFEDLPDRLQRPAVGVGEQCQHALFRVGAGLALVGDHQFAHSLVLRGGLAYEAYPTTTAWVLAARARMMPTTAPEHNASMEASMMFSET